MFYVHGMTVLSRGRCRRMLCKPGQHVCRIPIRREDRIEHFFKVCIAKDQGHALDQRHAFNRKRGQSQGVGEGQLRIAQQLERQMEALGGFPLTVSILRAQAEHLGVMPA